MTFANLYRLTIVRSISSRNVLLRRLSPMDRGPYSPIFFAELSDDAETITKLPYFALRDAALIRIIPNVVSDRGSISEACILPPGGLPRAEIMEQRCSPKV